MSNKHYTIDGEPAPTCPQCKRVVGNKNKKISPHAVSSHRAADMCPMSGKPDGFLVWGKK